MQLPAVWILLRRGSRTPLLTLAAACWLAGGLLAHAGGVVVETQGFEAPTFNTGALETQNGWQRTQGPRLGAALIENGSGLSGRGVHVHRAGNSDDYWGVPNLSNVPSGRFAVIDWDMKVAQSTVPNGSFGPYFAASGFDQDPAIRQLFSFGVDAATGDLLYQLQDTGFLQPTGNLVAFDAWNHYRVLLDFTNHEYRAFFNGGQVALTGFIDRGLSPFTDINQLTDADIQAVGAAGDGGSLAATGDAYFDNFVIRDGIAGDFDQDGDVDGADLTLWESSVGVNANANSDGDNDSDGADLLIWQREKGVDLIPTVAVGAAIPEPTAALLAGGALFAGLSRFRRRSAR